MPELKFNYQHFNKVKHEQFTAKKPDHNPLLKHNPPIAQGQ